MSLATCCTRYGDDLPEIVSEMAVRAVVEEFNLVDMDKQKPLTAASSAQACETVQQQYAKESDEQAEACDFTSERFAAGKALAPGRYGE